MCWCLIPRIPWKVDISWPHFRDEKTGAQRGQSCDQKEMKLGSELLQQKNVLSMIAFSWFTKINIGSSMPGESKGSVISFFFILFFFLVISSQDYHLVPPFVQKWEWTWTITDGDPHFYHGFIQKFIEHILGQDWEIQTQFIMDITP